MGLSSPARRVLVDLTEINPYSGYDDIRQSPFLFFGPETPDDLPAMARVLTVDLGGEATAYPYDLLQEIRVANDIVGDQPVVIFWGPGTTSAFGQSTGSLGDEVGTANAFSPVLDGEPLIFYSDGERILDAGTNSTWNTLGIAIDGPLAGSQLESIVGINHFWFSWAAFRPETLIYSADG